MNKNNPATRVYRHLARPVKSLVLEALLATDAPLSVGRLALLVPSLAPHPEAVLVAFSTLFYTGFAMRAARGQYLPTGKCLVLNMLLDYPERMFTAGDAAHWLQGPSLREAQTLLDQLVTDGYAEQIDAQNFALRMPSPLQRPCLRASV